MSGYHPHNVFRTDHWDSLEKALTVFVLPYDSARKRIYRRVDLIFAAPDVFWTAVVGWWVLSVHVSASLANNNNSAGQAQLCFNAISDSGLNKQSTPHSILENELPADMLCYRGMKFDSSGM